VLLTTGTCGAIIYFRVEDGPVSKTWDELIFWVGVSALQTLFLLLSLFVLRFRGYRLVAVSQKPIWY
jgi:hypothetical protein